MGLTEFAKEVLPTSASKWLAVGTLSTVGGFLLLPKWLPELLPLPRELEALSTRLLLSGWLLFLGSFLILVVVLFHVKALNETIANKRGKPKVDVKKRLEPEREKVLVTFIKTERLYETRLEDETGMNIGRALFHLGDLVSAQMANRYNDGENFWVLGQEGRRYLVTHKLLP